MVTLLLGRIRAYLVQQGQPAHPPLAPSCVSLSQGLHAAPGSRGKRLCEVITLKRSIVASRPALPALAPHGHSVTLAESPRSDVSYSAVDAGSEASPPVHIQEATKQWMSRKPSGCLSEDPFTYITWLGEAEVISANGRLSKRILGRCSMQCHNGRTRQFFHHLHGQHNNINNVVPVMIHVTDR